MLPPVNLDAQPLPMAPSGCGLDDSQLAEQLARYRQLSASVLGVERDGPTTRIAFSQQVQTEVLEQTLAIERRCCSFFTLDYDTSQRVLAITTDPEHNHALSVLLTALTAAAGLQKSPRSAHPTAANASATKGPTAALVRSYHHPSSHKPATE